MKPWREVRCEGAIGGSHCERCADCRAYSHCHTEEKALLPQRTQWRGPESKWRATTDSAKIKVHTHGSTCR